MGDVQHPGAYDISSLSTPLNALFAAGGPTAAGSSRLARHFRGNKLVEEVDLYDLLIRGVRSDMLRLQSGDTLLVPPLAGEITIEGMVRRPAIYELNGEKNLAEALQLAGGVLPTATLTHIEVQRLQANEKHTMLSLDIPASGGGAAETEKKLAEFAIQPGDTVHVFPIAPFNKDAVYLEGHVLRPGKFSYHPDMKLTEVIASYADLLPEPATRYAEIIRLNPPDYHPTVEGFDLGAALENPESAPKLQPLDTIRVFARFDFQAVPKVTVLGEVRAPGTYRTSGQVHLRDAIQLAGGLGADAQMDNAQVFQYVTDSELKITTVNLSSAFSGNPVDNILLGPRDRILIHRNLAKADIATVMIAGQVAQTRPLSSDHKSARGRLGSTGWRAEAQRGLSGCRPNQLFLNGRSYYWATSNRECRRRFVRRAFCRPRITRGGRSYSSGNCGMVRSWRIDRSSWRSEWPRYLWNQAWRPPKHDLEARWWFPI